MKIFCEIFHRAMNSSSRFNGACFQYISPNITTGIEPNQTDSSFRQVDDSQAALFVIVVVCFYKRDLDGRFYCWHKKKNDLYETQRDETKKTIHVIFNDSSKLLASVAVEPDLFDKILNTNNLKILTFENIILGNFYPKDQTKFIRSAWDKITYDLLCLAKAHST
ncbi:hypothetical protein BpHYR1_005059 [Brachionus plicatilis]|uniref:Uncharacterized protein n=1 Tax=Brachionus plicatilis TaxID=10195 RepID=A0A3M7T6L6_BRAPC|nr:hypothetical protein BpHYR1_005059 [Brachionus plicatilis]